MIVYWLLFAYVALGAVLSPQKSYLVPGEPSSQRLPSLSFATSPMLGFCAMIIALLIGFRYEVGGDWRSYGFWFRLAGRVDLEKLLAFKDPGYQFLNWAVQQLDADLWLVNLICGLIFAWGLWRLVRIQPDPWLAMLIAVPYLVIVVAMGYSRQRLPLG